MESSPLSIHSSRVNTRVVVASDSGVLGTGRSCGGSELLSATLFDDTRNCMTEDVSFFSTICSPRAALKSTIKSARSAGARIKVFTATGAGSYQWNLNGTAISGATANTYTASAAGDYTVTTSNTSGCTATSVATTVTVPTSPVQASVVSTCSWSGSNRW